MGSGGKKEPSIGQVLRAEMTKVKGGASCKALRLWSEGGY